MTPTLSRIGLFFATVSLLSGCKSPITVPPGGPVADWPAYGRDGGGSRYSPLTQITRESVAGLQEAWSFDTGSRSAKA